MGVAGVALVLGLVLAIISSLSLTRPLARLQNRMRALADGDLESDIAGRKRSDEIGSMAKALDIFRQNAVRAAQLGVEARAHFQQRANPAMQIHLASRRLGNARQYLE